MVHKMVIFYIKILVLLDLWVQGTNCKRKITFFVNTHAPKTPKPIPEILQQLQSAIKARFLEQRFHPSTKVMHPRVNSPSLIYPLQ